MPTAKRFQRSTRSVVTANWIVTTTNGSGTATSVTFVKMVIVTEHVTNVSVQKETRSACWISGRSESVFETCTALSSMKSTATASVTATGIMLWCIMRCAATACRRAPSIRRLPVISMGMLMSAPMTSGGSGGGEGGGFGGEGGSTLNAVSPGYGPLLACGSSGGLGGGGEGGGEEGGEGSCEVSAGGDGDGEVPFGSTRAVAGSEELLELFAGASSAAGWPVPWW